jgi:hypothetical protein
MQFNCASVDMNIPASASCPEVMGWARGNWLKRPVRRALASMARARGQRGGRVRVSKRLPALGSKSPAAGRVVAVGGGANVLGLQFGRWPLPANARSVRSISATRCDDNSPGRVAARIPPWGTPAMDAIWVRGGGWGGADGWLQVASKQCAARAAGGNGGGSGGSSAAGAERACINEVQNAAGARRASRMSQSRFPNGQPPALASALAERPTRARWVAPIPHKAARVDVCSGCPAPERNTAATKFQQSLATRLVAGELVRQSGDKPAPSSKAGAHARRTAAPAGGNSPVIRR